MGRGKRQSAAEAEAAAAAAALPKGAVVDASTNQIFVPRDPVSSDSDEAAAVQSTDTVAEVLAGNYSEGIVDEVRKYAKAEWDVEPSSLDPLDDIETFYEYDFRLPPEDYDAYQAAAKLKLDQLEELREAPDDATAAKIAARKELVKGKTADDLRWLKHKAYYRGINRIRAGKAADAAEAAAIAAAAAAAAEEQEAAAHKAASQQKQSGKGRRGASQQQQQQQQQPARQQQQQQQRYAHYSEDEVLAAVDDPSEWELGWTAADYTQHPQVLQQLRSTFSAGFGLPEYKTAAQQAAEEEATWQQLQAAAAAAKQQQEEEAAAKQALLKKHMPFQAYTPQYLEQQRRQRVLASHRRTRKQAFWLSLGMALGSSAFRWWRQRGSDGGKRKRAGSVSGQQQRTGGGGSSRRSTRPPTPSGMQIQGAIAE